MRTTQTAVWSRRATAFLMGLAIFGLSTLACSGNRRVSAGVGIHRDSSGNWGHSLSVGIHSNGRR